MSHEVETMAYAGETPWHGLGKKVDHNLTPEEMLVAAGLDWSVDLKPCYAWDEANQKAIPIGRKALLRSTDNKVLTVTGENWNPLQNKDALGFFKNFTDAGGATMETAGSLRGGKLIWALASLNEQFTVKGKTDVVKGYALLVSPHEVGNSIQCFTTTVRVVCANTMKMATDGIGSGAHRQHHMKAFDPKLAEDALNLCRVQLGEAKLEAQALADLEMSEFESVRFLARFFQPGAAEFAKENGDKAYDEFVNQLLKDTDLQHNNLEAVLDSYNNAPGAQPGTGWGVLNAVTHWADHKAGRSQDARLSNAWFGDRSRVKLQVNKKLLELTQ